MQKVEVDVGAGEDESVPHNPLLAGLAHEKTSDSLNKSIFTPRIFSVILP